MRKENIFQTQSIYVIVVVDDDDDDDEAMTKTTTITTTYQMEFTPIIIIVDIYIVSDAD
jgi:hypothetical protein